MAAFQSDLPPDEFYDQVKEVLDKIYDLPGLHFTRLASQVDPDKCQPGETNSACLRRYLLRSIDVLNPGEGVFFRSVQARHYQLIHLHYVEGMSVQEAAHALGLSTRQAYRDLRNAQRAVAAVMWEFRAQFLRSTPERDSAIDPFQSFSDEVQIDLVIKPIDSRTLLQNALLTVQTLVDKFEVEISSVLPREPLMINTDESVAQQIFTGLLSALIQRKSIASVGVELSRSGKQCVLQLRYSSDLMGYEPPSEYQVSPLLAALLEQVGWRLSVTEREGGGEIIVSFPILQKTALVIDDHEGLVNLIERYLAGTSFQVISAKDGFSGFTKAVETSPDFILLDIMMPGMDGWRLLQKLSTSHTTRGIPVLICSVVEDPGLALSLGAVACLNKPLSKDALFAALQKVGLL